MKLINVLGEYMTKKGKYFEDMKEFDAMSDKPARGRVMIRSFGSWSRLLTFVKKYYPDVGKTVAPKVEVKKKETKDVE